MTSVREACHCRERVPVGRFAVANGGGQERFHSGGGILAKELAGRQEDMWGEARAMRKAGAKALR